MTFAALTGVNLVFAVYIRHYETGNCATKSDISVVSTDVTLDYNLHLSVLC